MVKTRKNIEIKKLPLSTLNLPTEWWTNDTALFNIKDSLILLDYCLLNNIAILGFEGFKKDGKYRIPIMDYIIDFSELYKKQKNTFLQKSIEISKNIINSLLESDNDILFEFTLTKD
jgi:hypothetical protein